MTVSKGQNRRRTLTRKLGILGVTREEIRKCPPADTWDTVYIGEVTLVQRPQGTPERNENS